MPSVVISAALLNCATPKRTPARNGVRHRYRPLLLILAATLLAASVTHGQAKDQASPPTTQSSLLPRPLTDADKELVADRSAGALTTISASTGQIQLHWPAIPHTSAYWLFRSEDPKITVGWGPSILAQPGTNNYTDTRVQPGKRYYYAVISLPDDPAAKAQLVATGSSAALREDEALVGHYTEPPPTLPSIDLNFWDFVPREVFDELQSDRDDKANQLAQAQKQIEDLKAELAKVKAAPSK